MLPDGKVAPALLAAQTSAREQCAPACPEAVLLTVDGEQHALTDGAVESLSPDGRWLLGTNPTGRLKPIRSRSEGATV